MIARSMSGWRTQVVVETDGDVLQRGICGNNTGGAEEHRQSISHLTTLTGSAENTHIHHAL